MKHKVQFYVNDTVKKFLEDGAEEYCVSMSGFINVIISTYRKQDESLNTLKSLMAQIEEEKQFKL